jgi:thiol-disulfide isomerase/thioredoxin
MQAYLKTIACAIIVYLGASALANVHAQSAPKKILLTGDPLPEMTFSDLSDSTVKSISTGDFKNKWLVINFWNSHCMACLTEMPLLDSLQKEMSDQFTILQVGYTGSQYTKKSDNERVRNIYTRTIQNARLSLISAYDSTIFHHLDIEECPYILIIDPQGLIKAITYTMTRQQLKDTFAGKLVKFEKAYTRTQRKELNAKQKKAALEGSQKL